MNPVAPKTFEVLKWVLASGVNYSFGQRMIAEKTQVSLGQINKVFRWLEDNNFIEKTGKFHITNIPEYRGKMKYRLINPTGILRSISLFRFMKNNLIFEVNIDLKKKKVMDYLKKRKVIFGLDSALEHYDSYFRGDTICCYIDSFEQIEIIKKEFGSIKSGITKVRFYLWDFKRLNIRDYMNSIDNYTTELQTIIDLFCDNKAHYTKELLRRKWGIKL